MRAALLQPKTCARRARLQGAYCCKSAHGSAFVEWRNELVVTIVALVAYGEFTTRTRVWHETCCAHIARVWENERAPDALSGRERNVQTLAARSETILVADNDTEAADALIHSDIGDRIRVVLTGTSRDAIRAARTRRFELVLANLGLSDAAGGNLIPLLQDVLADTPIIAIDDDGDPESERFAFALGATWYLPKPLEPGHLLRVVRSTLRRPAQAGRETAA